MKISRDIKAKRPAFLEAADADLVLSALTNLLAEHWVLKERLYVVEQLAADKGLFSREDVEGFTLNEAQQQELAEARQSLLETVFVNVRVPPVSD